ncbi:MAG: hypothetical protein AAF725_09325 [Acidobacteriota bacterium]
MPLLHEIANLLMIIRLGCEKVKSPQEPEAEKLSGIRQIESACDEMSNLMRLHRAETASGPDASNPITM